MRGRIREALCPELQALRDENALLRRRAMNAYRTGYSDALRACDIMGALSARAEFDRRLRDE
jgi:hypothetical protein